MATTRISDFRFENDFVISVIPGIKEFKNQI